MSKVEYIEVCNHIFEYLLKFCNHYNRTYYKINHECTESSFKRNYDLTLSCLYDWLNNEHDLSVKRDIQNMINALDTMQIGLAIEYAYDIQLV